MIAERRPFIRSAAWLPLRLSLRLLRLGGSLLSAVLRIDRRRYPHVQNYLYERTLRHIFILGRLYAQAASIFTDSAGTLPIPGVPPKGFGNG